MKYKNEVTGLGVLIVFWVFMAACCLFVVSRSEVGSSDGKFTLYALLGFAALMTLIFMLSLRKTFKIRKQYKNIVKNGIKVQGCIVDYSLETHNYGSEHSHDYCISVTYLDPHTGEEKRITTPALSFDPIDALGDTSCSVYILDEMCYVTDFVKRKTGQDTIWWRGEFDLDAYKQNEITKVVIGGTIFALVVIFLCLVCAGVIRFN